MALNGHVKKSHESRAHSREPISGSPNQRYYYSVALVTTELRRLSTNLVPNFVGRGVSRG
jgi:hypothetical protein